MAHKLRPSLQQEHMIIILFFCKLLLRNQRKQRNRAAVFPSEGKGRKNYDNHNALQHTGQINTPVVLMGDTRQAGWCSHFWFVGRAIKYDSENSEQDRGSCWISTETTWPPLPVCYYSLSQLQNAKMCF